MTPSAFKYIGRLYESYVDRDLHLGQIGVELGKRGIRRTPCQIVHDLDNVFCFADYSTSHPAPEALTLAQIDAELRY